MLYTITNNGSSNSRPSQIGANTVATTYGASYVFTLADFTTGTTPAYSDPEGDALSYIKILTLPSQGELHVNDVAIAVNTIISVGVISTGNFKLVPPASAPGSLAELVPSFTFDCADVGSNQLSGLETGVMNLQLTTAANSAPATVGDNTVPFGYGVTKVFTAADFTTNTTPAYSDPESDAPYKLKITTLPPSGSLSFNGSPVFVNQEVLLSAVDSGYLVFNQDLAVKSSQTIAFTFSISDVSSEQFTS